MVRWSSVFVVLLFACGTKRNPAVCCTTQADCEALGVSQDFRCATGEVCVQNTCIEPEACQAPSDCPAATPHCADGTCAECIDDSHCGALSCNPATRSCVECVDSSDCGTKVCSASNTCVPCTSHTECASGYCNLGTGTCRGDTIVPRFIPNACAIVAMDDLVVSASMTIDTATACNAGTVQQANAPEICVVRHRSITIAAGVEFRVNGPRALALVADTALTVDGVIDISAGGAGGEFERSGGANAPTSGGGGAGFATPGGAGGSPAADGGALNGGASRTLETALLAGAGSNSDRGGYGGGAATLVSCRGQVTISNSGLLDAGGAGGIGGGTRLGVVYSGGGGGSGGTFVLQGMNVVIQGQAFANGGGGGAGRPGGVGDGGTGEDGENASRSMTPAAGGSAGSTGRAGGNGGTGTLAPDVGKRAGQVSGLPATPGGGGGSVGVFQTYTPTGITPVIAPLAASPPFQPNGTINTQ